MIELIIPKQKLSYQDYAGKGRLLYNLERLGVKYSLTTPASEDSLMKDAGLSGRVWRVVFSLCMDKGINPNTLTVKQFTENFTVDEVRSNCIVGKNGFYELYYLIKATKTKWI